MPDFDHLFLDDRFLTSHPYTTQGGSPAVLARSTINRQQHGNHIRVRFEEAIEDFWAGREERDFVYLEFTSPINFELDLAKFESARQSYRVAYIKKLVHRDSSGNESFIYRSGIYLDRSAINDFLSKIEAFLTEDSPQSIRAGNPKPKYNAFICNIEDIRAATLRGFWQESEDEFPAAGERVWWEVWVDNEELTDVPEYLSTVLSPYGIQVGQQWLSFPEHSVGLVKGTPEQLGASLLYTNRLAELRKPRETADLFTRMDRADQNDLIADLRQRVDNRTADSTVSVCLLDTGINRAHPLLRDLVPIAHLDSVIPEAGVSDTFHGSSGHGTPMAGLILYGDLAEALEISDRIQLVHHLESVKLISPSHPHDPSNYGFVTQEAIDRANIINSDYKRVVCLAITSATSKHQGKPTSWSAAVDQYSFGNVNQPNDSLLILVSSGNLLLEQLLRYPLSNRESDIHDPAQAFNVLTVGAYTQKDGIDLDEYPAATALATRGSMAPCNSTSLLWEPTWCRKPDIVMEGGNYAEQHGSLLEPDSLFLLSTAKGSILNRWFTTFGDTSGATALASRLAARLYYHYPHLWPETVRALIVHTADWTPQMLGVGRTNIGQLDRNSRIQLLQQVGYGVPNLRRAMYSANSSLTLIAESSLSPFKWEDSRVKPDKFHLYTLPWPNEVLSELLDTPVRLKVTLSYFIEPNPGSKQYADAKNYASHRLRFKMIDTHESPQAFTGRISNAMRDDDYAHEGSETGWLLGENCRNRGSIHKDIWEGSAADLATRHYIAVHPIGGWWKTRKKLKRYGHTVRYSLIVSIESPEVEVDIYTPVKQQVEVPVSISVNSEN